MSLAQRTLARQNLRSDPARTKKLTQLCLGEAFRQHELFKGCYRIGSLNDLVLVLVTFNQDRKKFEKPVFSRGTLFLIEEFLYPS